jgi:hypothetical protein
MRADTRSAVQVEGMEINTKIVALGMPVDFPHDEAR